MTADDWHATVTRRSDGKQMILIRQWRCVLRLELTRWWLDRLFRSSDRYAAKIARVENFEV